MKSEYRDRVRVYVMGVGTPQIGGDMGGTENVSDRVERMKNEIKDGETIRD